VGKLSLMAEIWLFLRQNKKLWLLPIILVLFVLGALLVFAQSSALAPFIYTIF
jgi:drug/metabolite transporter superfamily protein YnfA